jgi:tetratricopeptide (TPR) repeat protein
MCYRFAIMKTWWVVLTVCCATLNCAAQTGNLSDWQKLITEKKDPDAARKLCTPFQNSKVVAEQVEAEKCLANVELWGADRVKMEKNDQGTVDIYDEWEPESVDAALAHLNRGLQLAPQDLTIHQGRLHILEISRRYKEMAKALDESCTIYRGKEVPDVWLDYTGELNDQKQYEAALDLSLVLDKHYPNNPDILGNIGAFLDIMMRDAEAIPYLTKAIALAPNDPINTWDLGRAYDYSGQIKDADAWYNKALPLMTDPEQKKGSLCIYAEFVEKKLNNRSRACELQKQNCEAEKQTACAPASAVTTPH